MSAIFISHSSQDNEVAAEVAKRLQEKGHTSVFLDFHPEDGIPAGREWEAELYYQLRTSRAVIAICSEHSMKSQWCFAELTHAKSLGKHVIPVRIDDCEVSAILSNRQILDVTRDGEAAYERLWRSLRECGLDPDDAFEWSLRRPPYPGLLSFQEADAGVFFGRGDAVRDGLAALHRLWQFDAARVLLVLGASGSGKSSLALAGLLPRLRRDPERWLVLDPVRPMHDPRHVFPDALEDAFRRYGTERKADALHDTLCHATEAEDPVVLRRALERLAADLRRAARTRDARVLVTVDQAEELLSVGADEPGCTLPALVRGIAECPGWIVLGTLRSDYLGELQRHSDFRDMPFESLPLGPLTAAQLGEVITGPAKIAELDVEPALVDALVEDALAQDALPLLAFALREVWERRDRSGRLHYAIYEQDLGGLKGAVARTAEDLLTAAMPTEEELDALRIAFLSLTRLGEDGRFTRRVRPWSEIEARVQPLLRRFVDARLLVSRGQGDVALVDVAHEALFASWDRLADWLEENRDLLRARARIEHGAHLWDREEQHADFLLPPGRQLGEAESLLDSRDAGLGEREREFVEASVAARERARQAAEHTELERLTAVKAAHVARSAERDARSAERRARRAEEAAVSAERRAEMLRRAFRAKTLANESEGGRPDALLEALRAVVPELRAGETPHPEAEAALRLAVSRMERSLPLLGHTRPVTHAVFSPAGTRVLTISDDGTARIWDTRDGSVIHVLDGPERDLRHGTFLPDGTRVITVSDDRAVRCWDAETGRDLGLLGRHAGVVVRVTYAPDGRTFATASADGTIRIWDAASGTLQGLLGGHDGPVVHAAFSPDGQKLASASWDHTARIWNPETGAASLVLEGHTAAVGSAVFSSDGARVVTASDDRTARIWRTQDGALAHVLSGHGAHVRRALFSPDDAVVLTISTDKTARLWNAADGELVAVLEGHTRPVVHAAFSPDGGQVATASEDGSARVWDAVDGTLLDTLEGHTAGVNTVFFSPGGRRIVTASHDGTARLWEGTSVFLLTQLEEHEGSTVRVEFSPDGSRVVTAAEDTTPRVWDAETGDCLLTLEGHASNVHSVSFSPDGTQILAASRDGAAIVSNAADGSVRHTLTGHEPWVKCATFSPDGRRILTTSRNPAARIWDAATGALLHELEAPLDDVKQGAFSADGTLVATVSVNGAVRLWDARDGSHRMQIEGPTRGVQEVVFSPDGRRLLTASRDRRSRVRSLPDGKVICRLEQYRAWVQSACFSPDGSRIATGAVDGTAREWDAETGKALRTYRHRDAVSHVVYSPDGTRLLSGSRDGTARLWSSETGGLLQKYAGHIDYVMAVAFSPGGERLATAADVARIWSSGVDDLLWRARRLATPHVTPSTFERGERRWLQAQPLDDLLRTRPRRRQTLLAGRSVFTFHDDFESAATAARAADKLIFVAMQRYNPP